MNNDNPPAPMTRPWTWKDDKLFEDGLVLCPEETPDRWRRIAEHAGRSEQEVRDHHDRLVHDVALIESGAVEVPAYPDDDKPPNYKRRQRDANRGGRRRRRRRTSDAKPAVVQESVNTVQAEPPVVQEDEKQAEVGK